jgi:hypothetical protein
VRAHFVLTLAVLCGCGEHATIRPERGDRVVRRPDSERTKLATDARVLWTRPPDPPPNECEAGDVGDCGSPIRAIRGPYAGLCPCTHCIKTGNGSWRWNRAECNTPLVVAWGGGPVEFTRAPAVFEVGVSARTEWVSAATPWLALDRDGSGCIESARELFAGFEALAELDANRDGRIDARDPAFAELVLWSDENQDKRCTTDELVSLSARGIDALPLAFTPKAPATAIPFGSYEGDTASLAHDVRLVDVHLAPL